jgi:hypothetical protein
MGIEWLRESIERGRLTISQLDDGSGVVLDVEGEQLVEMNASAMAMVRALADGAEDERAVAELIAQRFGQPADRVVGDVEHFFARLVASLKH